VTDTRLVLETDGTFRADMTADIDALALGVDPVANDSAQVAAAVRALSPAEREAALARVRQFFERRVRVRFDGQAAPFFVSFPEEGHPPDPTQPPTVLGLTARLSGKVPPRAREVTFWASLAFPPVRLTMAQPGTGNELRAILPRAEESAPLRLAGPAGPPSSRLASAFRYLRLGFEHILPGGLDHILFVVGLFLLSPRLRPLLLQVSAFTVAHTATLALSTLGIVRLPSGVVEPLIALSIAYVAVENTLVQELRPWRVALVFCFGLLHGLGFAGALGHLGLPRGAFLGALLSFNLGVELGQLAVLALAFAILGSWRGQPWYRRRVAVPLSLAIAGAGLFWTVSRALGA
jgi:HupE / UreJ protein